MADLTPYVDLVEKVIDSPSSVQVDNTFTVGCVLPLAAFTESTNKLFKIRSQKELLKEFNGGKMVTEDSDSMLLNAYRLVRSSMLLIRGAQSAFTALIVGEGYYQKKYVYFDYDGDLIDEGGVKIRTYSNLKCYLIFSCTGNAEAISGNFFSNSGDIHLFVEGRTGDIAFNGSSSTISRTGSDKEVMRSFDITTIDGTSHWMARQFDTGFGGHNSMVMNDLPDKIVAAAASDAFDELYYDETCVPTMYSDLGNTLLGTYMKSRAGAYYSSETGVLLRTAIFNSLSGPNVGDERGSMFDADSMGMTSSMKAANGDQWIYHFPWTVDKESASFSFDVSPSVLYIESVVAARKAGHPYAGIYAHRFGVVTGASNLKVVLGRDDRDYLLSLGYNSIYKDERPRYNHTLIASNRTCTTLNNPMNKESHRRLANKLNFDLFVISEDFIGRVISDLLYEEIRTTVMSYIEGNIQVYPEALDEFDVVCDRTNNDDVDRANYIVNFDVYGKFAGEVDYVKILSTYFSISPSQEQS